ncbi:zinc-binding alcohol dehydrogenase [Erythrobacter sp. JK5]|uniref:zinc-dependent alcohol dehydrogenase n=1 Tax=Erythrobacter sp. JK5 TaxID=2829500 RepID=UPI001BA56523|nr:zinc-binding alcohol dehydrogenase [Erythrobacter sp. JK5]QUL37335.1 zinc-binding alcohol dehydrogenase [Erythrobacter sp. JK5]
MSERTAKVVWLEEPGKLALREESLAAPGPHDLVCETIVSAISPGTELAAWRGLPPLRPGVAYPRLQGYCNVARVIEVGEQVEGHAVGDRVLSFTSHRSHLVMPASDALYRLPAEADADRVVAAYLFHLGYNAVLRSNVRAGSRVLVQGLGVLGLTSVAMAALAGAEVWAVSGHASSAAIAKGYAARGVFARDEEEELKAALAFGADVVVSTTNGWSDFAMALRLAGQNGVIATLGFPGRGEPAPDFNPLASEHFYMKQLRIEAVGWSPEHDDSRGFNRFNERANIAFIARAIMDGRLDPAPILSGRYRGEDIAQAYADLDARKDDALTYLLEWSE